MEMLGTVIRAHVIPDTNQRYFILRTEMKPIKSNCHYQEKSFPVHADKT